jgi:beta-galactosidase
LILQSTSPGAGRLPPRAHATSDAPAVSLDGAWEFRLVGEPHWSSIEVPGHWQLQGHGRPAYTNVNYPFPVDPPHIPVDNPTGEYRRSFDLPASWPEGDAVLRFLGVDSAFSVALNGTELGWSTGSRLTTEFAVGSLLRPGANELAVRVHQWSPASYLEDQDQWWLSGIFRGVSLLARPGGAIGDHFVRADFSDGIGTLSIETDVPALLSVPSLDLHDVDAAGPHRMSVEPWTAETPRLYDATLSAGGATVRLRIGFRTVSIAAGQLLVNGAPIRLRGVNRHEWNPLRGRAVTPEDMLADVLLMKQHNINAVRTSHYPPHPDFLALCDEYGLWVILENDLETHGFFPVDWRGNPSDDPDWREPMLDRMQRTVERDKNHPAIIMWSLGNESGHGANLAAMAGWVHRRDPSRPVHYEGDAVRAVRVRARHGQRTRRAHGVRGAVRQISPLYRGIRLGVDRPRHLDRVALRVRRRLRRGAARRQLRHRRPGVPRPDAVARFDRVRRRDRTGTHRLLAGHDHGDQPSGLRVAR